MAINNPIITDSDWLQAAAVEIQNKDGGGKIEVPDFASRIRAIPTGSDFDMTVADNQVKMLVYIHPEIMRCCVIYFQEFENDVEVDWGDGSPVETSSVVGSERTTAPCIFHSYSKSGLALIVLTANQGYVNLIDSNGFLSFAGADGRTNGNQFPNNYYRHSVVGLSFGKNVLSIGGINSCLGLKFIINYSYGRAAHNSALGYITFNDSQSLNTFPMLMDSAIRNLKIPSYSRHFETNTFRNCVYLGTADFTDFTTDDLSQCIFGSTLFTGSINNGLIILFKDQETAEYAKTITNLSVWSDYIKYVGEV